MTYPVTVYIIGTEECYFELDTWFVTPKQYKIIKDNQGDYLEDLNIPGLIRKCNRALKDQYEMAAQNGQEDMEYHLIARIDDDDDE